MRAVADRARDGVGEMVKIEDDIANPLAAEPVEHALDERGAAEGHGRPWRRGG